MRNSLAAACLTLLCSSVAVAACGDCNQDGSVDIVDALYGAQHAVGVTTITGTAFTDCDVNLTAAVDVVDSLIIAQFAVGLPAPMCGAGGPGTCGSPVVLSSGVPYNGSTVGAPDDHGGGCSIFAFNSEKVHSISFTGTRTMDVTLSASFNQVLYVRPTCIPCVGTCGELGCTEVSGVQTMNLPGLSGGTYYIFVDGASSSASGAGTYTLTVTLSP